MEGEGKPAADEVDWEEAVDGGAVTGRGTAAAAAGVAAVVVGGGGGDVLLESPPLA